ncbi:MAG: transaldolase family protein [Gemmataceae bacterium]
MSSPLKSLISTGTKLWLDSIDPDLVVSNRALGATGATSNPIIISDLLRTGRFDAEIRELIKGGKDDSAIAWEMTDRLVQKAQDVFLPVWEETKGNDGYVSFELDPLLEDSACPLSTAERAAKYIELGKHYAKGHKNRMIKVPATPAGLAAVEDLAAAGITLNVTLIFSQEQYFTAREGVWRGAQKRSSLDSFKSVYSIFVSRLDVYTQKHAATLTPAAQGMVGIVNAKRVWALNQKWWAEKNLKLQQEIIFASTGTKDPKDDPCKYIASFAGSDIETNPPGTNVAAEKSGRSFTRQVDQLPTAEILADIDAKVDMKHLETTLMSEGLEKFADPFKKLLGLIGEIRKNLA